MAERPQFYQLLRKLISGNTIRKYVVALCGQSILGIFNFAVNILLVRTLSTHDYGVYALCWVLAMLATSVNNALCCGPLIVFGTARAGRPSRLFLESIFSTVNTILAFFVFILCVPLLYALVQQGLFACLMAGTFVASFTLRTYTRTFAYARLRPEVAFWGDLTNICVASIILALVIEGKDILLAMSLVALAAGNLAAMSLEVRLLHLGWRVVLQRSSLARYARIWRHVRWALLGATTTLVQAQIHSFLVTISFGPSAFAPLAAGQVVFGPVRIMMAAWHSVMQPEIVLAIRDQNRAAIAHTLKYSAIFLTGIVVGLAAGFAVFWHTIFDFLYSGKYDETMMRMIVSVWFAITACGAISTAPSGVLQTMQKYRLLAFGTVYGAIISTVGAAIMMFTLGPAWSLGGVLLGQAFMAQYNLRHAVRSARTIFIGPKIGG